MVMRIVLVLILILTAAAALLPARAQERPNILLLVAEDMSERVGAFGDQVAVTPHIDALALRGVRYPNTFTTAGVCAPSRAGLITGMHQMSIGAQHMRTDTYPEGAYRTVPPAHVKAFPEYLRAAGYFTTNAGFKLDYQFSGTGPGSGPFTIWDNDNAPDLWAGRDEGQPFFTMVNFLVTHESGVFPPVGDKPLSRTHAQMMAFRERLLQAPPPTRAVDPQEIEVPPYYPDTETVRRDMARHYDNISSMDRQVGAILDRLEAEGLAESTIVIWTTDHGDGLPRAKRELFESGIKVPMVIVWPERWRPGDAEPGTVDTRLISFVDLAPTILALAGVAVPDHMHGKDLRSANREVIFAARDRIDSVEDRQRAVRDARYKYIRSWYPGQPGGHQLAFRDHIEMVREMRALYQAGELTQDQARWFEAPGDEQLYDLRADPHELANLADDPAHEEIRARLSARLARWIADVGDMSAMPEAAMVAGFRPGGTQPVTPAPEITMSGETVTLSVSTPGASIGYRIGEGPWQLYTAPVPLTGTAPLEAKAVRYGWSESAITRIPTKSDD